MERKKKTIDPFTKPTARELWSSDDFDPAVKPMKLGEVSDLLGEWTGTKRGMWS